MAEQYEWEWLRRNPNSSSDREELDIAASDERYIQDLRRWVEPDALQEQAEQRSDRHSRRERRARLRQEKEAQLNKRLSGKLKPSNSSIGNHQVYIFEQDLNNQVSGNHEPTNQPENIMAKKKKDDYREHLKQDFNNLFESLELKESQKHYLRSRWLDQVLWMEGRAGKARDLHFRLRLTTIIGGVVIPALVSLNFTGNDNQNLKQFVSISTFALSQVVAISAATEQFFNHGERWRHYRRSVESLKTQGWQFFELSGPYQTYKTHDQAFKSFAGQIELVLQRDVEVYATQVTQAKKEDEKDDNDNSSRAASADNGSLNASMDNGSPNGKPDLVAIADKPSTKS